MFHKVDLMDLLSIFYVLRTALGTMRNKKIHATITVLKLLKTTEDSVDLCWVQMIEMQLDLAQLKHRKSGGRWEFIGSPD